MIRIYVDRESDTVKSITFHGHVGYAKYGEDIVCASVSALFINALNSIEALLGETMEYEKSGRGEDQVVRVNFPKAPSKEASLLIESMLFGIRTIMSEYGDKYVSLTER